MENHKQTNSSENLFAFGGDMQTNGSDFPSGLTHIDAGLSHEENPYEGVQLGKDRIELTSMDAVELIKHIRRPSGKTFCYLDPPYYVKGRDLYLNYYNDEDHKAIAEAIKKYKGKWIISYDAVPFISELYKDYRRKEYYLSYSAGNPSKGKEIMVYSEALAIPDVEVVRRK